MESDLKRTDYSVDQEPRPQCFYGLPEQEYGRLIS